MQQITGRSIIVSCSVCLTLKSREILFLCDGLFLREMYVCRFVVETMSHGAWGVCKVMQTTHCPTFFFLTSHSKPPYLHWGWREVWTQVSHTLTEMESVLLPLWLTNTNTTRLSGPYKDSRGFSLKHEQGRRWTWLRGRAVLRNGARAPRGPQMKK